jgi:23S rRNA (uracil1939-C5)-methyltransferase
MAIGDVFELRVDRLTSEGAGIGRLEGRAVFVEGSAPGERIRVGEIEERPTFIRGRLIEILEPSPFRVSPACPHFGECGGCALQHVDYGEQLVQKCGFLRDAFARIGGFPQLPEIRAVPSEPYGYRNRMQFHRLKKRGGVGLMRKGGREVLPIQDCPIADEGIRTALKEGSLLPPPWLDRFRVFSRDGLLLCEGQNERGEVSILGKPLKIDVAGFFQSNAATLETLLRDFLEIAASEAGEGKRAIDLYCGVGTFGAFLADLFPSVDLVELDKRAAALARENVRGKNVRLFAFSDDEWAKRGKNAGAAYDFAVVDPPRVGLSAATRRWLAARPPRTLAYVSCDPATLARDAKDLCAEAFELSALTLYDFYPQTPHIESFALFRRRD